MFTLESFFNLLLVGFLPFTYTLVILADRFDSCGSGHWPLYISHVISAFQSEFNSEKNADAQYAYVLESEAGI